jgi:tyrosinase
LQLGWLLANLGLITAMLFSACCRFCLHENSAFGPWHRPYMRLFEIHLKNACTRVAKAFPLERLRAEAEYMCDTLRAPFWDATESPVPPILTQPNVKVLAIERGQVKNVEIRNPLTYYTFRVRVGGRFNCV